MSACVNEWPARLPLRLDWARAEWARRRFLRFVTLTFPAYAASRHHSLLAQHMEAVDRGEISRLMVELPPRHGKALAVGTPVPTPGGWANIEDLRSGQMVFDEQGWPTAVIAVSETWQERPVYSVRTDCGDEVVADAEHEWVARLDGKRPLFKRHTTTVIARPRSKRAMIRRQGALALPEQILPADPYVLGLWLGDGYSQHATITAGDEDRSYLRGETEKARYTTTDRATEATFGILGLQIQLRRLGVLDNKHIPRMYLRASISQRLALLQGLVDTDGHIAPDGQVEFCSTNAGLAWDTHELVCSLGHKASMILGRATLNGRDCGAKYRVMFYMANAARLPRKAERCRDGVKTPDRYISAVPCGVADTVCIQVAAESGMFLCGRSMLPTHNSELVSVRFPAWYMGRHPERHIIACSYAADLAHTFSRQARNLFAHPDWPFSTRLAADAQGVENWATTAGGGYVSAGVGGAITGHGADLLLIDDPVKNREEADSQVVRDSQWEWYTSTARTRLQPGAAVVLCMTRWHEDDLGGRLLAAERQGGERWTLLRLPALAEADDPLGRESGVALWPEWYDATALDTIRRTIGSRDWSALYQQRPTSEEGAFFKRSWFRIVPSAPVDCYWVRFWDLAVSTKASGDYTVGARVGFARDGTLYIADTARGRWEWPDALTIVEGLSRIDGKQTTIAIEDAGQQKGFYQMLLRVPSLRGLPLRAIPVHADKQIRARAWQARAEAGKVALVEGNWNAAFLDEVCSFPVGQHDDQVDAVSGAVQALGVGPATVQTVPIKVSW